MTLISLQQVFSIFFVADGLLQTALGYICIPKKPTKTANETRPATNRDTVLTGHRPYQQARTQTPSPRHLLQEQCYSRQPAPTKKAEMLLLYYCCMSVRKEKIPQFSVRSKFYIIPLSNPRLILHHSFWQR